MQTRTPPSCFSMFWEEENAECAGGLDPLFSDPEDDSNKRPPCAWFGPCGNAFRQDPARRNDFNHDRYTTKEQPLIPVQQLTRSFLAPQPQPAPRAPWQQMAGTVQSLSAVPQVPLQPAQRQVAYSAQPTQYQQPHQQQQVMYQQPQQQYNVQMVPPPYAVMPQYVPMNYAMPGTQVPSFLTVPEAPGAWKTRLVYSLLRGIAKAAGMVIANFFDHTPIVSWQPPPPPAPQPPAQPNNQQP